MTIRDMPQSAEEMVNPAMEIRNTFFRSNRVASHPVNGIVTAAATIEDVSTRIILSGFELHDKKLQK